MKATEKKALQNMIKDLKRQMTADAKETEMGEGWMIAQRVACEWIIQALECYYQKKPIDLSVLKDMALESED
jgi:hypothetical protein